VADVSKITTCQAYFVRRVFFVHFVIHKIWSQKILRPDSYRDTKFMKSLNEKLQAIQSVNVSQQFFIFIA